MSLRNWGGFWAAVQERQTVVQQVRPGPLERNEFQEFVLLEADGSVVSKQQQSGRFFNSYGSRKVVRR